jgi:pimeloyl-ACP methyl ester carboxylesterase
MLVCGTDDSGLIEPMKVMASKLKSELVWIQDAGHGVMYEKPNDYNEALGRFLSRINY